MHHRLRLNNETYNKNHKNKMPINPEITIKKIGSIFVLTSKANIMKTIIIAFMSKFMIS